MLDKKFCVRVVFDVIIILGIVLIFAGGYLLYQQYWQEDIESEQIVEETENGEVEETISVNIEETGRYPAEIVSPDDKFSLSNHSLHLAEQGEIEFVDITIPPGANALRVGQILDEANLVEFEEFNRLQLMFDFSTDIRAGDYTFSVEASTADILQAILL